MYLGMAKQDGYVGVIVAKKQSLSEGGVNNA